MRLVRIRWVSKNASVVFSVYACVCVLLVRTCGCVAVCTCPLTPLSPLIHTSTGVIGTRGYARTPLPATMAAWPLYRCALPRLSIITLLVWTVWSNVDAPQREINRTHGVGLRSIGSSLKRKGKGIYPSRGILPPLLISLSRDSVTANVVPFLRFSLIPPSSPSDL